MNYHVVIDGKAAGPYTIEQIAQLNITPETLVWHTDLDNWVQAQTIPELKGLFIDQTSANPNTEEQPQQVVAPGNCPQQHLGLAIFSAIMFPTGIAAIVKTILIRTRWNEGRYDDAIWLARSARRMSITSIIIGAVILLFYITYYSVLIATLLN